LSLLDLPPAEQAILKLLLRRDTATQAVLRATYDDSMLSWRLTRRQRTDLLDKIK
jgi:hypothetical protein